MSRSHLFSRIKKALAQAQYANRNGWKPSEVSERFGEMVAQAHSRRTFLKTGITAAAGVALLPTWAHALAKPPRLPASQSDPVLILGAGAEGLAAAYTLLKAGVPFRILEAGGRVGGRIFTQENFTVEGQFVERGAELVDSNHETLIGLATELGLLTEDFAPGDQGLEAEVWYFGGKVRKQSELVAGLMPIAKLVEAAKKEGADFVSFREMPNHPGAAKWDRISVAEMLHSLHDKTESWILNAIGTAYLGENGREISEQSSLNFITMIDTDFSDGFQLFGASDETKRVKGGSERLTERLHETITAGGADTVALGAKIVAIASRGGKIVVSVERDNGITEESATQVICALPFSVLREVDGLDTLGLQKEKLDSIRTLGYGQNSKIMLEFSRRLWREKGSLAPASIGAIYGDFHSQTFWETSRLQAGEHGVLTNFLGGKNGYAAGHQTVPTALNDLSKIYQKLPHLFVKAIVQNWNHVPTVRASYTCFLPEQTIRYGGVMGETELNGQLLFAGEHTSHDFFGFMNGAYESGVTAATEILTARAIVNKAKPA